MIANPFFDNPELQLSPVDLVQRRSKLALLIMRVAAVIFFVSGVTIFLSLPANPGWQILTLVIVLTSFSAVILYLSLLAQKKPVFSSLGFLFCVEIAFSIIGVLVKGTDVIAALLSLVFSIVFSSILLGRNDSDTAVTFGIFTAFFTLLGGVINPQLQIELPFFVISLPPLVGVLIITYFAMVMTGMITVPLRIKIIIFSLLIVIIPLVVLSIASITSLQSSISESRNKNLILAADRTANVIDNFIDSFGLAVNEFSGIPQLVRYLEEDEITRLELSKNLENTLITFNRQNSEFIQSIALLDDNGLNVFDTDKSLINNSEADLVYFNEAYSRNKIYVSDILFEEKGEKAFFYVSSPITTRYALFLGILRIKINAAVFQSLLVNNQNLAGSETYPILLDENQVRIADTFNTQFIYKSLAPFDDVKLKSLKAKRKLPNLPDVMLSSNIGKLSDKLTSNPDQRIFSATMISSSTEIRSDEIIASGKVKSKPWTVLYTQHANAFQSILQEQTSLSWLITIVIALLATVMATFLARTISQPIMRLTSAANQIVMGDLNAKAEITTNDEVGNLASMFNAMTTQLRTLISELEDRISARTKELNEQNKTLAYRNRQVETIAEVARHITSAQDLEELLTLVTDLVSQRFGFYHAGVFLVDEKHEFAVLRAANSEGGKRMLAKGHQLKVGQVGIVGYATGSGKARIASSVGEDSVYFNNPYLPLTRSEMALPLKSGTQVIGALDIQSEKPDAFSQEDIELFSTLADQIAIGIINSRLLNDTQKALAEAESVHRQYLKQEWVQQIPLQPYFGYQHTPTGLQPIIDQVNPEIEAVIQSGKMSMTESAEGESDQTTLSVPVILKGQVIGAIQLQDKNTGGREWNETEINAAQAVADQVAQALENARLFEQTTRRAERERKVLEITGKIRSTNDPQEMINIAIAEVKQALGANRVQLVFKEAASQNGNNRFHPEQKNE